MLQTMRVLIAPQAFKGSLTALEAAQAVAEGARRALPRAELLLLPVADGGDGTLEVLMRSREGRAFSAEVTGPLGQPVTARWGVLGDGVTAVIESAQACGLLLVPPSQRNPEATTTYGVGQLMRHALDAGYRRLVIGVGGTATNDGGVGLAQALGVHFLDDRGRELRRGGVALQELATIDTTGLDPRVRQSEVQAAVDVANPLCGLQGTAVTYAPQKGASPGMVELLDRALAHLAEAVRRQLHREVADLPGARAGGG
ncbi:MAG: glycerate kinase, partial [Chloroflexi bacterium]|nr:glycerate kinase [Chloroflexota bacterium]